MEEKGKIANDINWNEISKKFASLYGEATYNSWIRPLKIYEVCNNSVIISAPTRFIRDWVVNNYQQKLEELITESNGKVIDLDIVFRKEDNSALPNKTDINPKKVNEFKVISEKFNKANNNNLDRINGNLYLNNRQRFDNFVVSQSNRLSYFAANQLSDIITGELSSENAEGLNPLYIYGGIGNGKTHLLNAIGNKVHDISNDKNIVYLSAERFMFKFVKALKENNIFSFKEEVRNADLLLIDDIHFFSGKGQVQEEFLHCFNSILESGGNIVIASDRCPNELDRIDERLKSRLSGGLVTELKKPDLQLRTMIIEEKAKKLDINVCDKSSEVIANKLKNSVRELIGFLNKLKIQAGAFKNRQIDSDCINALLSNEFLEHNELTISSIKKAVCKKFDISVADIDSARRSSNIARPRQIAMYLAKKYTKNSLPEIGRSFGGKNHATVIHSVKAVEKMKSLYPEIALDIRELEANFS